MRNLKNLLYFIYIFFILPIKNVANNIRFYVKPLEVILIEINVLITFIKLNC